jgi:hypothetical protein
MRTKRTVNTPELAANPEESPPALLRIGLPAITAAIATPAHRGNFSPTRGISISADLP